MFSAAFRAAPASRRAFAAQSESLWKQLWSRQSAQNSAFTVRPMARARGFSNVAAQAPGRWTGRPRQGVFSPLRMGNRTSRRGFRFSSKRSNSQGGKEATEEAPSLSARLKKLSKEYGWSAVGVYLGLSVLDFPFCFLLVRTVGTDKIGELEHWLVSNVSKAIPESVKRTWNEYRAAFKDAEQEQIGNDEISEHVEMAGWGVEKAEQHNRAEASLGTQLALAYAIHKSFIFIRVPLTAAVTPKVVKVLRSWGWQIGKKKTKSK